MNAHNIDQLPELTKNELQLLNILWKSKEGLSVREVHQQIEHENQWAYSTTKTTMDRMVKKALLKRANFHGVFLYQAAISKPAGLAKLVNYFMNDVLEMDNSALMSLFGASKALSESEVDELESLLKQGASKREAAEQKSSPKAPTRDQKAGLDKVSQVGKIGKVSKSNQDKSEDSQS